MFCQITATPIHTIFSISTFFTGVSFYSLSTICPILSICSVLSVYAISSIFAVCTISTIYTVSSIFSIDSIYSISTIQHRSYRIAIADNLISRAIRKSLYCAEIIFAYIDFLDISIEVDRIALLIKYAYPFPVYTSEHRARFFHQSLFAFVFIGAFRQVVNRCDNRHFLLDNLSSGFSASSQKHNRNQSPKTGAKYA